MSNLSTAQGWPPSRAALMALAQLVSAEPQAQLGGVASWLYEQWQPTSSLAQAELRPKQSPSACAGSCSASELEVCISECSTSSLAPEEEELCIYSESSSSSCLEQRAASLASQSVASSAGSVVHREEHAVYAADGWRLALQHAWDPALRQSRRRRHPALLVPGLASSGGHTFDLCAGHSLVDALVSQGYDVWVADLRGNGRSQRPSWLDGSSCAAWTVDTHFEQDVPAVLQYVLQVTGAQQVHWVGHSMGGMLAVGLLSQQHKLAGALRSVTMLASGCFGRGSWHSLLRPLIEPITCLGFPAGLVCAGIGALSRVTAAARCLEALFYWPSNMPRRAARRLMSGCFAFIPAGIIRQFMGSLNSEAGLSAVDNSFRYADPQVLARCTVPIQGLVGSWDLFCPPAGGRQTVDLFGSSAKRFVEFGPRCGTGARSYGHFDIVAGHNAASEVWPYVLGWLAAHDEAPGAQPGTQP